MMVSNTRRIEVEPGVWADVPVEVVGRAMAEAELRTQRQTLAADLTAVDDAEADARLEKAWLDGIGQPRPADLIRAHADELLAAWDTHEDRMRARLRLPPRNTLDVKSVADQDS